MQILILSSKFPYPLKDGGAIATYQIIKGLKEQGHFVYLLSFNTSKHHVNEADVPTDYFTKDTFSLIEIDTSPNTIKALKNLIFSTEPYILERFKSTVFSEKLKELLQNHQFDIVQVEALYMLDYVEVIRENSNAKIAYRPHNLEHQIWHLLSQTSGGWIKRGYFRVLSDRILTYEKTKLNLYDVILPIAAEDAGYYERLGVKKPMKVVPTGFDITDHPNVETTVKKHRLFFIGSLEWLPNQEGLIWFVENCWHLVRKRLPDLNFYIAGRNAPQWLRKKLGIDGVIWSGEVESATEFIEDKTIMLVPLLSGSGMRIKIIEAFIQSKAVVATSVAVHGTGAKDGQQLLIANNPSFFVEQIVYLVENRELYQILVKNAFVYAKNSFDNTMICKDLCNFYQSGLKTGS